MELIIFFTVMTIIVSIISIALWVNIFSHPEHSLD